jgi:ribosome-binding protein aMBF1 (putative translation factor)
VKEKEIEGAAMKFCMGCANFEVEREKKNEEKDRGLKRQTSDTSDTRTSSPYRER